MTARGAGGDVRNMLYHPKSKKNSQPFAWNHVVPWSKSKVQKGYPNKVKPRTHPLMCPPPAGHDQ
jgi:hypothetical protein